MREERDRRDYCARYYSFSGSAQHPHAVRSRRQEELGIRYEGPALAGPLGVRQAIQNQACKLSEHRESNLPYLGPGVQPGPVPFRSQPANAADVLV
jgi:hypothetical protein